MAQRWIFHVDMDAFYVSVEELLNPDLKGKPVVVGGDPDGRGVVSAASYEIRKYGVHSAMPLSEVKRRCPHAIFLRGRHGIYGAYSDRVFSILSKYTPDIEKASVDEGYLDMTGFGSLYGHVMSVAHRMKEEIRLRTGLNASFGISSNKLVSKVASCCCKPNAIMLVLAGYEKSFLAPLKIERLPGVGKVMHEKLRSFGISTIGDLAGIDKDLLVGTFGKWGLDLYRKANGLNSAPVQKTEGAKSISRERTFDEDTIDMGIIHSTLFNLVEKIGRAVRAEGLQARCITLKLRYSDFKTITRSITLRQPTDIDKVIYENIGELFEKAYTRRGRIRLLGAGVSNFTTAAWQPTLFDEKRTQKLKDYYKSIDAIRNKYGTDAIRIFKEGGK